MFKISIITGEAWLENVGLCLISPFYPSVRHLGAAYKGRRSMPIQYQTAAGAGVGGVPSHHRCRRDRELFRSGHSLVLAIHPDNHCSFYAEESRAKNNSTEFFSIFSREGWNLSSFFHSIIWCKNTMSGKESVSIGTHLAASNRNLKLNRVEHYGNKN